MNRLLLFAAIITECAWGQPPAKPAVHKRPESAEHKRAQLDSDNALLHESELWAERAKLGLDASDIIAEEDRLVAFHKLRLHFVDICVSIYHKTIDKKASDVTIRESELVKECQSLDLYPPAK
jgi:hypothetical protein